MRIYICLLLAFATEALARSKYKDIDGSASFKDSVSVSAGSNGLEGGIEKDFNVKPFNGILDILGLDNRSSENKETGLNINGKIAMKPKLSIDENGAGIGMSLDGDLGFGISNNDKSYEKKGHSKYKNFNKHHEWWEKSNSHEYINNSKDSKKHDELHKRSHEDRSYWDEGQIIIPFFDENKSDSVSEHKDKTRLIEENGTNIDENDDMNIKDIIFLPLGEFNDTSNSGGNKHERGNKSLKDQINHDGKKEDRTHVGEDGGEKVIISYGQSNSDGEEHNEKKNENSHIKKRDGIVISYEERDNIPNVSKKHEEPSTKNGTKKDGKYSGIKEGTNNHTDEIINVTLSYNHDKKSNSDDIKHNNGRIESIIEDNKTENTAHDNSNGIKEVNTIISENHGNQSENSIGQHNKYNTHPNNYNETLGNGKCGSNIRKILKYIQTWIYIFDDIVYFLMKIKETDLRNVLCHISPRNSKLSCQLGCDISRVRSVYKPA